MAKSVVAVGLSVLAAVRPVAGNDDVSPDGQEEIRVYLTESAALDLAFPQADSLWSEVWSPTNVQRRTIERRLGWRLEETSFTIHQGSQDGERSGFAIVGEEVGLYRPITFMVKVDPKGRAETVQVMVYRESRGGEVRRQRFLSQYGGKSVNSPIRINRDIIGITGATLSVRAMNAGVKKALAIVEAYRKAQAEVVPH